MEQDEKQRKKKAWATTASIQLVLLLLFYFLVAWREPNPPNPEFGIELNFGQAATGSGSEPVSSPTPTETIQEEQIAETNTVEDVTDSDQESTESQDPVETVENVNADVSQEETEASSSQKPEVTDGQDEETTAESNDQVADNTNDSQGETGETGDQGNPDGDINADALYGKPGGGDGGSSLQMSGWEWDAPPEPDDTSQEAGKIVFEIEVDSDGYFAGSKLITSTVSPAVLKKYEASLADLTFSKTSSYKPASRSKGRVTFIIRAR